MISNVGVIHIHPVTEAVAHVFPLGGILPDRLLALFNKRLYAVFFYILLAVKPQLFFYFEFYGQSMRVPAGFTQNVFAFHSAVTRNYILHNAR